MMRAGLISEPRRLSLLLLRLALGSVFIYAGIAKLTAPLAFADGIAAYRILPAAAVNVFALSLPPFEMMLGIWLLSGWRLRSAGFCAAFTLLVFVGALASARWRGLHIDCACFGPSDSGGPVALARDAVLTAAALVLYAVSWRGSLGRLAPRLARA